MISSILRHILLVLMLVPSVASAHSANDPAKDIEKLERAVNDHQAEFGELPLQGAKIENLQQQISSMERKLRKLRNLLSSDYPHVKAGMSKYEMDYMERVDVTLAQLRKTLKQARTLTLVDE